MKFRKTAAILAAAAMTATASVSASATLTLVDDGAPNLTSQISMWMCQVYVPNAGIDFGIDCPNVGSVQITFTPATPEDFENLFQGAVIVSSGPTLSADHNWNQKEFAGVNDSDLGFTASDEKELTCEKTGDYTYTVTCPVDDTNSFLEDAMADPSAYAQVAVADYGSDFSDITITKLELFDKSGASMAVFDGKGNLTSSASAAATTTTTSSDTQAATAGDTTAATDSSKGSPDTGIEDVAVVAGLALVAGGAIAVAKKRK